MRSIFPGLIGVPQRFTALVIIGPIILTSCGFSVTWVDSSSLPDATPPGRAEVATIVTPNIDATISASVNATRQARVTVNTVASPTFIDTATPTNAQATAVFTPTPVATPIPPIPPTSTPVVIATPSTTQTAKDTAQPDSQRMLPSGRCSDVDGLKLCVDSIEVVRQMNTGKMLRVKISVENNTSDSVNLPIFGNFVAVDNLRNSYTGDHSTKTWPLAFASGLPTTGSIDLETPVDLGATSIAVGFTKIFGSLRLVGKSILVNDNPIP